MQKIRNLIFEPSDELLQPSIVVAPTQRPKREWRTAAAFRNSMNML